MYTILLSNHARKALGKLERLVQERIVVALDLLKSDPRPPKAVKLRGEVDVWRIRVGDYRILYEVIDNELVVWIVRIANRKDIYRKK
ncbi:MAG: type II toxin-antitoxin system RelE/ParE family toxin [Rhodothermales bacterium]